MCSKVLIIEDTASFSSILKRLVSGTYGFEVDVAASFAEAELLLAANSDYFVAIVDLNLPDAPQGEAVDLVVSQEIPAVVFTASDDKAVKENLWVRGIADYAHKSGAYSLEYVLWIIDRIYKNKNVEVLVVDDALSSQLVIKNTLKVQNYVVHCASSGEEALEVLRENPGITIALVDRYMDGMDGIALTAELWDIRNTKELEIIGLSGAGDKTTSAQFIKAGANDFLVKPFLPEELLCRVNRCAERIDAFRELKKLNDDKNTIIGMAAHDIRGPLGSIHTASSLILNRNLQASKQNTLIEMIERSSGQLLELLETLLDMSAVEGGKTQLNYSDVDLSQLIEERIELYEGEAKAKRLELKSHIVPSLSLKADEIKVKQLVDNLITNAIKYSPRENEVSLSLKLEGQRAVFCVADHGPGVKKEEQAHLFEAYAVLSSQATGGEKKTGLGLAIARKIANAHNGRIYYADNEGGGSCFYFELPLSA